MSESISFQSQAVVARSSYTRVQRLLVVAVVAVIGLTVAVILLATSQNGTVTVVTPASAGSSFGDTALQPSTHHPHGRPSLADSQSAAAQIGATLNHRGSDPSQSAAAQIGARLNHRGS
jgi:CelD/BcsL family acetyltransferase involved in cellulose biosynthesis